MNILKLESVSLEYSRTRTEGRTAAVLRNIDLDIADGEFVVVIGRSGSGKTSLLNLAAGFVAPTGGRITVDGRPIAGPGRERAVVFQDDALYPWLSARDNVAFPLRLRNVPRTIRNLRADELLELVGLADAGERKVWELSGGMRQRVGIARALASEPRFLLMDEPLGALDALTRSRMQSFLLQVWQASSTGVLLITHSIDEALFLATRVVVLEPGPGRIAADIGLDFGRRHLAGEDAASLRASTAFKAAHERLTRAINAEAAEVAL
jgi:taurine transport system ATP-binding protein